MLTAVAYKAAPSAADLCNKSEVKMKKILKKWLDFIARQVVLICILLFLHQVGMVDSEDVIRLIQAVTQI